MAKRELRFFVGVAFVLFLYLPGGVLAQSTIHVPADAATIQAAINAANNGDTVLVAPGTYPENINFSGKSITVESSAGPAQTTIVGQINGAVGGQTDAATVTFSSGETRSSVISGFTISTAIFSPPSASNGIYIFEANPTITNNIITNSTSYGISLYWGGALISGNTISNTSTDASQGPICDGYTGSGIGGGGSSFLFDIEIVNNIIENNVACEGGGIYLDGPPETTITNNIIRNNQGLTAGGGIYMENVRTFPIIVAQNLVYGNFATEGGGGMDISIPATSIPNPMGPLNFLIASNTITGNSISPNPTDTMDYGNGSQIEFDAYVSQVGMFNNIITSADSYATIACNPAFDYLSLEPPVADYNDIVNSSGPQFGGWCTTPAGGTGNISAGPQFSNAAQNNYQPAAGSPVIDTGFNAAPGIQPLDFNGNPRIQNATGITAATVDMGAYELSGVRDDREATLTSFSVNPANPTYGQNATFSADVTATEGVSAGTVTFLDDWTPIGQSNVNTSGLTTLTTSQLAAGTHWIVAEYGGTTGLDQSVSAADSVTVQGIATTTTVTVSPNPVYSSQPVTISANVSSALGGLSGTISFVDYFEYLPNPLGSLPIYANGTASITVSTLPDETNDIEAVYSGDSGHASSTSSPVALSVQDFFADASAQYPTIKAGQTGTGTIFVEPYGGLTGTITFTCTTPSTMYGASCSASPIQLNGTPVETTTFSISTTSPAAAELSSAARTRDGRFPFLWSGSFLLICFSARGRRSHFLFLILLIPLTLASVSCGGGSGGATIPTQPGTYAIIFNGTIGPISHSFGSTVVVQ